MEPRERLKRYLEQRRELGERELMLDGMTVDDVMRIVGAAGSAPAAPAGAAAPSGEPVPADRPPRASAGPRATHDESSTSPTDWRETLRASGVDRTEADTKSRAPAPATDSGAPPGQPVSKRYEFPRPADASPPSATVDPATSGARSHGATAADRPAAPAPPPPSAPPGLIVGTAARDLFGTTDGTPPSLIELAEAIRVCTRCRLYATATNAVPGEGDPSAELVCVGEAPGANEDATGRPFVGQAGQLLTKILAAINLRREDVFICNVLKHRPPGNRNPLPDEVTACSPYLVQQLEAIRPKVIVAFGTFAAQTLLNTKLPIGKLRGSVHRYYGIPLIVTYHPAALLRNPAWKRPTWEDVQLARRILDSAPRA